MSWEEFALETTKLLRVRVFSTPRLCAFSSARWFHTELILGIPPFSVKHAIFCRGNTRHSERNPAVETKAHGEECVALTAGQGSHCEVSALSDTSLLCATTFMLQQLLRFVCAWKFWDIWHISHFPAAVLLIQSLACLAGSSSFIYRPSVTVIAETFRRLSDFV